MCSQLSIRCRASTLSTSFFDFQSKSLFWECFSCSLEFSSTNYRDFKLIFLSVFLFLFIFNFLPLLVLRFLLSLKLKAALNRKNMITYLVSDIFGFLIFALVPKWLFMTPLGGFSSRNENLWGLQLFTPPSISNKSTLIRLDHALEVNGGGFPPRERIKYKETDSLKSGRRASYIGIWKCSFTYWINWH